MSERLFGRLRGGAPGAEPASLDLKGKAEPEPARVLDLAARGPRALGSARMGLLERLRGDRTGGDRTDGVPPGSLAGDAAATRIALTALHAERARVAGDRGAPDLRGLTRDLLEGEIESPTADVRWLISAGTDPEEFYEREIGPNWDGLNELERADKLDGFVDLAQMVDASPEALPREMAASVRTKTLILAWAFDQTHGFLGRLASAGRNAGTIRP
jgi:hypothetical protein